MHPRSTWRFIILLYMFENSIAKIKVKRAPYIKNKIQLSNNIGRMLVYFLSQRNYK